MFFQKRFYLTGIIIIVIIVGFVFSAVLPLAGEIRSSSDRYTENKKIFAKMDKEVKLFELQEKLLENTKSDLSNLERAFLKQNQEKIAEFLSILEDVAQKIGISVEIKSAVPPTKANPYFTFKIFLEGNFPNLTRFLAAVENNLEGFYRLIEIESLNMQRVIKNDELTIECSLDLKVYSE